MTDPCLLPSACHDGIGTPNYIAFAAQYLACTPPVDASRAASRQYPAHDSFPAHRSSMGRQRHFVSAALAACRTEVFSGVATSGILPAIGKLAGRRAGVEAILAQLAGLMKPAAGFVPAEPALRRASG